jgi:hypothetical protein
MCLQMSANNAHARHNDADYVVHTQDIVPCMCVVCAHMTKNIKDANFGGMFLTFCLEPINQIATSAMP